MPNQPLPFPPEYHSRRDIQQSATLALLGFTVRDLEGMNVVELYDRAVEALRVYKPEMARQYADQLFGPEAWRQFDFLREEKSV
jgi:hypothetical protein